RNDVKESPGFLEKLANRFVPHVGTAKLGANWTSTPLAAISSPPASPATASAATASRATSACATPGSGAMTGVHYGRPGVAPPSTAPPAPASAVPRVFDDDRACHTDHRLEVMLRLSSPLPGRGIGRVGRALHLDIERQRVAVERHRPCRQRERGARTS